MGKVAVVTGAAQGIGVAIAERFAELGFTVVILDVQDGEPVAERLSHGPGTALFHRCDLTDAEQVLGAAERVRRDVGPVNVLVNNAGWTPNEYFMSQEPDVWARIIGLNLVAVMSTCHAFLPVMADGDAIVNVASDAGRIGVPRQAVYSASKAGVIGFSKALSVEVARQGVRVNVVCPGTTRTPLLVETLSAEQIAQREKLIPLRRLGEPVDVARSVAFLATEATHVTGQVLSVSGGAARVG